MTRPHRLAWLALWLVVGVCVWALVVVGAVAVVDSHSPQLWTVPPSAITPVTTPSGEQREPEPAAPSAGRAEPAATVSPRLPRWSGVKADQSPVATHEAPAVSSALPTARPAASHSLAELVATGTASFYDAGSGLYAALPGPWRAGRWVTVCGMAQCVSAPVVTTCGCWGPPAKVIDLSPELFERVSGMNTAERWQRGVTTVSLTVGGKP